MLKKLLGVILAISMVLSLFPATVSAADEGNETLVIEYGGSYGKKETDYHKNVAKTGTFSSAFTDYAKTGGFWKYVGIRPNGGTGATYGTGHKVHTDFSWIMYVQVGNWVAVELYVPVAGTYNVDVANLTGGNRCYVAYKFLDGDMSLNDIEAVMQNVTINEDKTGAANADGFLNAHEGTSPCSFQKTFAEPGKYTFVAKNISHSDAVLEDPNLESGSTNNIRIYSVKLTKANSANASAAMGFTTIDKTDILTEETANASFGTLYDSSSYNTYTPVNTTYVSSNEAVATVAADGTVTGVGAGTAEISAVVDGSTLHSVAINVTERPQEDKFLSFVYKPRELEGNTNFGAVIDYSLTNGLWVFNGMSPESEEDAAPYNTGGKIHPTQADSWVAYVKEGRWVAFELNVPKAGTYYVDVTTLCSKGRPHVAYKILEGGISQSEIDSAMKKVTINEEETGAVNVDGYLNTDSGKSPCRFEKTFEKPGKYIFVAKNIKYSGDVNPEENIDSSTTANIRIFSVTLTSTTKTDDESAPVGYVSLGKKKLLIGEKTTATVSEKLYDSVDWNEYTAKEITFESSNNAIATVDAATGAVEAKAEGTVEIAAIADGYQLTSATLTVEKYESAPETLSLWVESDADGDVSVTVNEAPVSAGTVAAAAQGATVKVTAEDTATHRFSHWLGTAGVASFDKEYTFNIYTNTALKAVYEEIPTEDQAVVSFYKPNRELFATEVVDKNTTFSAIELDTNNLSLVGYTTFKGWALGEDENEDPIMVEDNHVITGDLGVVAVFDGKKTVEGFKIGGELQENVAYGQEFTKHSIGGDNFSYWEREDANGQKTIVSYNKTYTFYAWQDNVNISSFVSGKETPEAIAVLEKYGTTDSWMFEYEIPANCERLEAGIIFGNSNDITIDSCYARAVSRRGAEDKHGQFTASSEYPNAKGYIIFKDSNNKTRVVYSK